MHTALYRSFRPEVFDEILGQEHIVKILKNQLVTSTLGHAYLFCGTRGTGKTSTARILAKGVNCISEQEDMRPCGACPNCIAIKDGVFMDVVEIDAASNNGVENIRELRESVKYPPAVGRCKVYIIDEVHMLSTGAFNALLKTLEEPPENVMFILATTEPQKLPATILSRCLRLDFKRISEDKLRFGMKNICRQLNLEISDAALGLIAANADGSVRDGLSLLDQCISTGETSLSREAVLEVLGTAGEEVFIEITEHVSNGKTADALLLADRIIRDGKDVRQFMKDWVSHYRNLLLAKYIQNPEDVLNMSSENVARLKQQCDKIDLDEINESIIELSKSLAEARWSTLPRVLLELCIVKLSTGTGSPVGGAFSPRRGNTVSGGAVRQQAVSPSVPSTSTTSEAPETPRQEDSLEINSEVSQAPLQTEEDAGGAGHFGDLDELWQKVFEEGTNIKGSFNLLRGGTTLKQVTGETFQVAAASEILQRYAKANAQDLEALMEKHTGKKMRMECILVDESCCQEPSENAETLANSIGRRFDINIEVN